MMESVVFILNTPWSKSLMRSIFSNLSAWICVLCAVLATSDPILIVNIPNQLLLILVFLLFLRTRCFPEFDQSPQFSSTIYPQRTHLPWTSGLESLVNAGNGAQTSHCSQNGSIDDVVAALVNFNANQLTAREVSRMMHFDYERRCYICDNCNEFIGDEDPLVCQAHVQFCLASGFKPASEKKHELVRKSKNNAPNHRPVRTNHGSDLSVLGACRGWWPSVMATERNFSSWKSAH